MERFDVQVSGSGIVGLSLALALSRLGLSVAFTAQAAGRSPPRDDVRAYALSAASIALLRSLKVWEALPADARTPVYEMRVHGDAPSAAIEFSAWEQCVGSLACITDAATLEHELATALRFAPHVTHLGAGERHATASLVAHCEGRGASHPGARFGTSDYGQRAIAARLVASQPHAHVARQWFRAPDVLALLPFDRPQAGRSYGLVWSLPTDRADALLAASAAAFEIELAEATGAEAGELHLASERAAWPLAVGQSSAWCGPGWVLLGDAAHVVHPLAGQGLNLGLADVVALVAVIAEREPWRGLGDERLLRRYVRQRAVPTWAMLRTTDALQRLFSHSSAPVRELRNNGLSLVNRIAPLKRWLVARALDS